MPMLLRTIVILAISLLLVPVRAARAVDTIIIEFSSDGLAWSSLPGYTPVNAGPTSSVTINNANSVKYRVYTFPGVSDIGSIRVNAIDDTTEPHLFVGFGLGLLDPGTAIPNAGCANLGSISRGLGHLRVQARTTGNITGNISVWQVVRVDCGGTLSGHIDSNDGNESGVPGLGFVGAASYASGARVKNFRGSIGTVTCTSSNGDIAGLIEAGTVGATIGNIQEVLSFRDMLANVQASGGSIGTIRADRHIGAAGTPVTLQAKTGIANIQAGKDSPTQQGHIYANVTSNFSSGNGSVTRMRAVQGDFIGSLAAQSIPGGTTPSMLIGRDVNATITIGPGALPGQAVFNSDNVSTSGTPWQGTTTINGNALTPLPAYGLASMPIGNGAIGKAPYRLYNLDCMPPNMPADPRAITNVNFAGAARVHLRFYGPVQRADSGTNTDALPALSIEKKRLDNSGYDAVSSGFTATFQSVGSPGSRRAIIVDSSTTDPAQVVLGTYRVRPLLSGTTRLVCAGVTGSPVVDSSADSLGFQYFFKLVPDCTNLGPADFNNDGFVNPDDLSDFITCFFMQVQIPGDCPAAEFNGDGFVNPDDLSDFITVFFLDPCQG